MVIARWLEHRESVFASFENPDESNDYTGRLDLVGTGAFEGTVKIPKLEQAGTWKLVIVAADRAGGFLPAFSGERVAVKLTHFLGSATVGTKINDLSYQLTPANEATITLTNGGTRTITEDILLQWADLYKFCIEVSDGSGVVANQTFEPWIFPLVNFSFPVTLGPGGSETFDVKGYKLSSAVSVGSQPSDSPYVYRAASSGSYHLEVAITNPSPVDHTAPFIVEGMADAVQAVVYRDGVPMDFFEVDLGVIVFEDTIKAGESVAYEVKALTQAELATVSADYHLPKTYKIGIQATNTSATGIANPRAFVVWTPENAVELVTSKFMGCVTNLDKKTGDCQPLAPEEKKHVQWNFRALESADVKATMWIDGDNILPLSKEVVFTVSP